jgi:maleylpyruvate isomerase
MTPAADPMSFAAALVDLEDSTTRLLAGLEELTDADVAAPSTLPGWTRGHVLTHLARNADGLANLAGWAVSGTPTPMYASIESRAADIEAGAGRSAHLLHADVRDSAVRLRAALREVAGAGAPALERGLVFGPARPGAPLTPAHLLPSFRRTEVEVHRADLDLGYGPDRWPQEFAVALLDERAPRRAQPAGLAGITSLVSTEGASWSLVDPPIGSGEGRARRGPVGWLAAWLMGRAVPAGRLRTSDDSPVPPSPSL